MNICFETFGCRLSRAEALDDEARCVARGHRIVTTHADADLIVVRGCSVTRKAQNECERLIDHLSEKYPFKRLAITGCLEGARPFEVGRIPGAAPVPMRTSRAYLKVQDGCDGKCAYCIVPRFRGEPRSVIFSDVVDRARRFVDAGYREIVVTGCNLALYRSQGRQLPELAAALAELDPGCRVRIGSVEPGSVARALVQAMSGSPGICRFLHLPVQSGSDEILGRMGRPYRVHHVERLLAAARQCAPEVAIGCDMIAGFPGETPEQHMESTMFLRRNAVVNVHAFPYSERPGTAAARMSGSVPQETRSIRARALAAIGDQNRRLYARQFVGRRVQVVVETHRGKVAGWTGEYLWLECPELPEELRDAHLRRRLMDFRVTSAHGGRLFGELA